MDEIKPVDKATLNAKHMSQAEICRQARNKLL
jgi:hypothetical protein